MLLDGFKNTLIITFGALLIGIVLGTTVAVIKFLAAEKAACVRWHGCAISM